MTPHPAAAISEHRGDRSALGGTAAADGAAADGSAADAPKYEFESLIAEGAEGRVFVVSDRDLQRRVAMKVMQPHAAQEARHIQRFLNEARRTAALGHAAIPAVHDLGYVASGEMFFTMRLVEGRTLREVFDLLCSGDPDTCREWTLVRIVQVLQQVAAAMDYAHTHGVLHRDLKPENIAVSEYHEVLVLDWGLSKRIGPDPDALDVLNEPDPFATAVGAVKGTPLYMAPEQARGAVHHLDPRADVFSLGAILYEALCHEPPYDGASVEDILDNAKAGKVVPIEKRAKGKNVPPSLAETCMRSLAADKERRHPDAKAFADDLQAFLEGTKELELRAVEVGRLLESGRRLFLRARTVGDEGARIERMAADLRGTLPPWAPAQEKARLWQLEDGAGRARVEAADTHARATDLVSRALALEPGNPAARATLAQLYFDRFVQAERAGRLDDAAWLRRMVERFDDGVLGAALASRAALRVEVDPVGAEVSLVRVQERGRRLVETERRVLGLAPVGDEALDCGDWLVCASADGRETARVPLRLARGERRTLRLRLPPAGLVPPGFVFVPAGPFLCGDGAEAEQPDVAAFAIQERPVLLREYAEWLDDLARTDPGAVEAHVPWVESHGALLHVVDGRHVFRPAGPDARQPFVEHPDLPVVGVTRESASAYGRWLGARLGATLLLPTEQQWEKAARGTDGRRHPWGDHFDASFCSMLESTREPANLRPVAAFPADVSPFGVRDMAGNARSWCRDDVEVGRTLAVCRGGAWYLRARGCSVLSRWIVEADSRNPGIGFRLCREWDAEEEQLLTARAESGVPEA